MNLTKSVGNLQVLINITSMTDTSPANKTKNAAKWNIKGNNFWWII